MVQSNGAAQAPCPAVVHASTDATNSTGSQLDIGIELESVRRDLVSIGTELSSLVDNPGAELMREAVSVLAGQSCSIAVVGQIKAGKSSFVNALIRQPGLLPTDVNPWTTAVTNLRFRQAGPNGVEAVFSFFSEEEWDKLAQGGGRLRELTERLVPGFEPALLRHQVLMLKARAAKRLGAEYLQLVGRSRQYPRLSRDTLLHYVCSGNPDSNGAEGRYSEVTRSADVYLTSGPFAFPVTVIDTPGTNDPFLVRDEVTRAALDQADITLVLLTAHQPLSDTDVSLLRILRGLHKERIIIVINRIDELADPARDSAEIVGYVRQRLTQEFPGSNIPIVPGSARWGASAHDTLPGSNIEQDSLARALAYCRDEKLLDHNEVLTSVPATEITRSLYRSALFAASGLPRLYIALNTMMPRSRCGYLYRQFCRYFAEMSQTSLYTLQDAREAIVREHNRRQTMGDHTSQMASHLRKESDDLRETTHSIGRAAHDFEQQMSKTLERALVDLGKRLHALVDAHAQNEGKHLVLLLNAGQPVRTWGCDSAALSRELADEVMASFHNTELDLGNLATKVNDGLRQLTSLLMPGSAPPAAPVAGRNLVSPPSIGALAKTVALDLDTSWWSHLWKAKPDPRDRGTAVANIVRAAYRPVIEELLASYRRAFEAYIATTAHWSAAACDAILQALANRQNQVVVRYASIERELGTRSQPADQKKYTEDIAAIEGRIARASEALHRLRDLNGRIEGWLN